MQLLFNKKLMRSVKIYLKLSKLMRDYKITKDYKPIITY